MAKAARKKKKRARKTLGAWKNKQWYTLVAPKIFEERELGETPSDDPGKVLGRVINTTLRDITGSISQQHIQVQLKVTDMRGNRAITEPVGYSLQRGYLRRQMKRKKSIVTTICEVTTKDMRRIQVTSMSFCQGNVSRSREKSMRAETVKLLAADAGKNNFDNFFQRVIFGKTPSEIYKKINKIFPVARTEIVKMEVLPGGKKESKAPEPEVAPAEAPEGEVSEEEVAEGKAAPEKKSVEKEPPKKKSPKKKKPAKEKPSTKKKKTTG
jgi:small subunit ribosomal protein S3Ae